MKKRFWSNFRNFGRLFIFIGIVLGFAAGAHAQTTEFTYQGRLQNAAMPANGNYDFEFLLFDSLAGPTQIGATISQTNVAVAEGVFNVKLDFGSQFPGASRFLEIHVKQNGGGAFTPLSPRQSVSSAPYAVKSLNADNATNATNAINAINATNATTAATATNATQLSGQPAAFYQNATNLNSGTLPDARLSANVATLTGTQTFTGPKTFSAPSVFNNAVGIGTVSPGAPLDVQVATGQSLQFRQDSGLVPGINVNSTGGNPGIMRFRNTLEVWPSDDSTRAGKVDVRNTAGNSTISLDGQTGNISAAGVVSGNGSGLTDLNASNISSGTLPSARLSGSYTGALTLNNVGNAITGAFSGSGFGLTGLNASNLSTGTLADARLSANVALLTGTQTFAGAKTFSAASVFNSSVGIGTSSPQRALSIVGGLVVDQGNQNTTSNTFGISFGSLSGEGITSNRGVGANPNGLDFFAGAGPGPRMSLTNGGNFGIGTTSPGARLDVQVATGQSLQFRQDSGLVPGINVNTTGGLAGIMRIRNNIEIWPSDDATRAGKVSVWNTTGSPTISLDGQTGNISATGPISSSNFPRAKVVQTYRDVRNFNAGVTVNPQESPNIDSIIVNIPSSGVLILRGTIQLHSQSAGIDSRQDAYFKLSDNTGSPVTLCETDWGYDDNSTSPISSFYGTLIVEWTVPVNAGIRNYGTSLYNASGFGITYFSTSLQAIFIPSGL